MNLRTRSEAPGRGAVEGLLSGVSDGTRTRDIRDHNQVLYQLSYTHHDSRTVRSWSDEKCTCCYSVVGAAPRPVSEPPCSSASSLASADAGPGGGTKTAAR